MPMWKVNASEALTAKTAAGIDFAYAAYSL